MRNKASRGLAPKDCAIAASGTSGDDALSEMTHSILEHRAVHENDWTLRTA